MGKTAKGKDKAKVKIAQAKAKIARKVKRGVAVVRGMSAVVAAFALALLATGCSTAESQQPAKSATMSNEIRDSVIIVAAKAKIPAKGSTNAVIEVEGGNAPTVEILTLTQSLESTGSTDTFSQTATQTPTTDVKPKTDLRYNDAIGAGGSAAKSFVDSLSSSGLAMVSDYIKNKKSGTIEVEKKDGTKETVTCENGKCTTSDGTTITAEDCEACTDCTPAAK